MPDEKRYYIYEVINVIWDVSLGSTSEEIQTNEYHTRSKGPVPTTPSSDASNSPPKANASSKNPTTTAGKTPATTVSKTVTNPTPTGSKTTTTTTTVSKTSSAYTSISASLDYSIV